MRHRPDVERNHLARRAAVFRKPFDQHLRRRIKHLEGPVGRIPQSGIQDFRQARFEHCGVIGGLVSRERKIGASHILKRFQRRRFAPAPRFFKVVRKALEIRGEPPRP